MSGPRQAGVLDEVCVSAKTCPSARDEEEMRPILNVVHRSGSRGAVIGVEGSFDVAEADELCSLISRLDVDGSVMLDFHRARTVSDVAIARLANGLLEIRRRIAMVGLSTHQHRLLRYMGLRGGVTLRPLLPR